MRCLRIRFLALFVFTLQTADAQVLALNMVRKQPHTLRFWTELSIDIVKNFVRKSICLIRRVHVFRFIRGKRLTAMRRSVTEIAAPTESSASAASQTC